MTPPSKVFMNNIKHNYEPPLSNSLAKGDSE